MLKSFPGPHAVGIPVPGQDWTEEILAEAAACLASFSPKARQHGDAVDVSVERHGEERIVSVRPDLAHGFEDNPTWPQTRAQQKDWERQLAEGWPLPGAPRRMRCRLQRIARRARKSPRKAESIRPFRSILPAALDSRHDTANISTY